MGWGLETSRVATPRTWPPLEATARLIERLATKHGLFKRRRTIHIVPMVWCLVARHSGHTQ